MFKECNKVFKRGEVWLFNLGESEGSIQGGKRPCLVISNNRGNTYSNILTVLPISSASTKLRKMLPTHILLTPENSAIKKDSVIMAEQITVISKEQAISKLFEVDDEILEQVGYAVAVQIGMLQSIPA